MKQLLPWNITGIPPEAREAARTAAAQEGLTVGEWLTRRIFERDAATSGGEKADARRQPALGAARIEESLRTILDRLDAAERDRTNTRSRLTAAAGEHAEALKLLTERMERIERQSDGASVRDAVRGLHQGLSNLADQIGRSTSETAHRLAELATHLESPVEKSASAPGATAALEERLERLCSALDSTAERVGAGSELSAAIERIEARIASSSRLEEAVARAGDRAADSARLEELLSQIKACATSAARLEEISAALESRGLAQLGKAGQIATNANAEKLEQHVNAAEQRIEQMLLRHFASIEDGLETIAARFEKAECASGSERHEAIPIAPQTGGMAAPVAEALRPSAGAHWSAVEQSYASPDGASLFELGDECGFPAHLAAPSETPAGGPLRRSSKRSASRRIGYRATAALLVLLGSVGAFFAAQGSAPRGGADAPRLASVIARNAGERVTPVRPLPISAVRPSGAATVEKAHEGTARPDSLGPDAASLERATIRAQAGDVKAELALGIAYADGAGVAANDAVAAGWLEKAAKAGEPVAQYRLGTLYERGRGMTVNAKRASYWYAEAAKRGNRKAMHNLAVAYANGAGVDTDFAQAAHWFRSAAELGLTDSQFNLAVLYERGLGVPASLVDAYKWYAIAAASGDSESRSRVEALATQLRPDKKADADAAAKAFRPKPMIEAANEAPEVTQLAAQ